MQASLNQNNKKQLFNAFITAMQASLNQNINNFPMHLSICVICLVISFVKQNTYIWTILLKGIKMYKVVDDIDTNMYEFMKAGIPEI